MPSAKLPDLVNQQPPKAMSYEQAFEALSAEDFADEDFADDFANNGQEPVPAQVLFQEDDKGDDIAPSTVPVDENLEQVEHVNDEAIDDAEPLPESLQAQQTENYASTIDRLQPAEDIMQGGSSIMHLCQKLHDDNSLLRSKFAGMISLVHKSNERSAAVNKEKMNMEHKIYNLEKEIELLKTLKKHAPPAQEVEHSKTAEEEEEEEDETPLDETHEENEIWKGVRKLEEEYFMISVFKHKAYLDEYREAFNHFDADGSGSISAVELGQAMTELGQTLSEEELTIRMAAVDADNSGEVDFNEFLMVMGCSKATTKPVIRVVAQRYESEKEIDEEMHSTCLVIPTQLQGKGDTEVATGSILSVYYDDAARELKAKDGVILLKTYDDYQEPQKEGHEAYSGPVWKGGRRFGGQFVMLTLMPLPPPNHHKMRLTSFNIQKGVSSELEIDLPLLHRWTFASLATGVDDDAAHHVPSAVVAWCLELVDLGSSGEIALRSEKSCSLGALGVPQGKPKPKKTKGFKMLDKKKPGDEGYEGDPENQAKEEDGDDDDEESEVPMDVHIEGVSFPIIHTEVYTIWRGAKRIRGVYYLMNMEFSSQLDAGTVIVSRTRPGASEPEIVQMKAPSNLVNDCYENRRLDKMREWGLRQLKVQHKW